MYKLCNESDDSLTFTRDLQKRRLGRRNQLGAGQLKAIVVTIVLVLLVYSGWKLVPPYINEYQLHDKLVEEARYASVNRRTDEELRKIVFQEIQDLDIPARLEDIKVDNMAHSVRITVDYTVPVDILGYHAVLHFTPTSENKALN
jgi:hypothetical protein